MQEKLPRNKTFTKNEREKIVESPEGTAVAQPPFYHTSPETERPMVQIVNNKKSDGCEPLLTLTTVDVPKKSSKPPAFDTSPLKKLPFKSSINSVSFFTITFHII